MSSAAMGFMIAVCTVIVLNVVYCFYKLLTSKRQLGSED